MPNKIITYKMPPKDIVVGIPFTWGTRSFWAIKVEDGDIYIAWEMGGWLMCLNQKSCGMT